MYNINRNATRSSLLLAFCASGAILVGCSQETADRAATAVENAPAQVERGAERAVTVMDDASITAKVKTALIAEPDLKGMAIDVDTAQNVVTLNGTVASDAVRERAERIAKEVEGVKEVRNQLLVKPT
jgi:hyperosmotically inducible protein